MTEEFWINTSQWQPQTRLLAVFLLGYLDRPLGLFCVPIRQLVAMVGGPVLDALRELERHEFVEVEWASSVLQGPGPRMAEIAGLPASAISALENDGISGSVFPANTEEIASQPASVPAHYSSNYQQPLAVGGTINAEGKDQSRPELLSVVQMLSSSESEAVREVWEYWASRLHPKARWSAHSKRARKVRARLRQGFSVADLKRAVDGAAHAPTVIDGRRYDDLELICRDEVKVEDFMSRAPGAPDHVPCPCPGAVVPTWWQGFEGQVRGVVGDETYAMALAGLHWHGGDIGSGRVRFGAPAAGWAQARFAHVLAEALPATGIEVEIEQCTTRRKV